MRLSAIDEITRHQDGEADVARLEQRASRTAVVATALMLVPVLAVCVLPFGLVAAKAAGEPGALAMIADRPLTMLNLALGFALAIALVAYPIRTLLDRIGRHRTVVLGPGRVIVTDRALTGERSWSEPLSAFRGVAHHIRASLSAPRHEIVLVHADPARSILLHFAPKVQQAELEDVARTLGLPIVPARAIYRAEPAIVAAPVAAAA